MGENFDFFIKLCTALSLAYTGYAASHSKCYNFIFSHYNSTLALGSFLYQGKALTNTVSGGEYMFKSYD